MSEPVRSTPATQSAELSSMKAPAAPAYATPVLLVLGTTVELVQGSPYGCYRDYHYGYWRHCG